MNTIKKLCLDIIELLNDSRLNLTPLTLTEPLMLFHRTFQSFILRFLPQNGFCDTELLVLDYKGKMDLAHE